MQPSGRTMPYSAAAAIACADLRSPGARPHTRPRAVQVRRWRSGPAARCRSIARRNWTAPGRCEALKCSDAKAGLDKCRGIDRARLPVKMLPATEMATDQWVSKTDLVRFVRCPLMFWLIDTGRISQEAVVPQMLVDHGRRFEWLVRSLAAPLPPGADVLRYSVPVLGWPGDIIRNEALKIYGKPDGVVPDGGAMIPVEIKSHRSVKPMDRLELGFYWLLLDVMRIRKDVEPAGWIYLRGDRPWKPLRVSLSRSVFDEVLGILDAIRSVRNQRAAPGPCRCGKCPPYAVSNVEGEAMRRGDLECVRGIRRKRASQLMALGIRSYWELAEADPEAIASSMKGVSVEEVEMWRRHARSLLSGVPVVFGTEPFPSGDLLALDCEYHTVGQEGIWMVGLCVVRGSRRRYRIFLCESPEREKWLLTQLADAMARHPDLQVVTWNGASSDVPQLSKRAQELRVAGITEALEERHVDVLQLLLRNVRLPITRYSLDNVAEYLGIRRSGKCRIYDGLQANGVYQQFLTARGAKRNALRRDLLNYSREDLKLLVGVISRLPKLREGTIA